MSFRSLSLCLSVSLSLSLCLSLSVSPLLSLPLSFLCCYHCCSFETGSLYLALTVLELLSRPGWLRIHNNIPASVSPHPPVLRLKVCATMPGPVRLFFSFFKISLFYVCEYTVAVFRHNRRGHHIPLQMVVSHHVVGCWELNSGLLEEQSVLLPAEPSLPPQDNRS